MLVKPRIAWITANRSCNFRCLWCYGRGENFDANQTMSPELASRLLSIIEQLDIKNLIIIGGEPTIWEHLFEFNGQCLQLGIKTTLVTNAYRFSNDDFWAGYMENPNDKVSPSIKAFDEESAKSLAQILDFEMAREGLRRILQKFGCGVSFVLNSFVKDDLVRLAQFAKSCGSPWISISPCTPSFSCDEIDTTGMLTLQEIVKAITSQYQRLHELMEGKLTLSIKTPLCLWPKDFIETIKERKQLHLGCQFQERSGIIFGPQGEILACNSMAKFPIGKLDEDYADAESLVSLLNSEQVTQSYDHINSYPSEKCISCSNAFECSGGCPLMWTVYEPESVIKGWHNR